MTRVKLFLVIIGVIILIPITLALLFSAWVSFNSYSSNIINYQPTKVQAIADTTFFYSIGNDLKYSNHIDPEAPTLFHGAINNYLVSPDNKKIAVVSNGKLMIVSSEKSNVRQVTPVKSIFIDQNHKHIGESFFHDQDFQWSRDSKLLYLIKDEYYNSVGAQLFSNKGELWTYDLATRNLRLVYKPFPAFNYFFDQKGILYFSVPNDVGDLQLEYYDGHQVRDIGKPSGNKPYNDNLIINSIKSPFYSFYQYDYGDYILPVKGVQLVEMKNKTQELLIDNKPLIALSQGMGFKGPYYCSNVNESAFLPGDRYFVFNLYCGNYDGQLLIDASTGKYMTLPKDTQIYITLNTNTYKSYQITGDGIEPVHLHSR
ncbi:MAG: hypothetical protein ACYDCJ_08900 [Gammaproteobacteria bacterium]